QEAQAEMSVLVPPEWAHAAEGENTALTMFRPRGAYQRPGPAEARSVRLLSLVAGLLLAVACTNLAGLLIARGSARERELAVRASLGRHRMRLVRQLMTEAFLLAAMGGIFGILLSFGLTTALETCFFSVDSEGYRVRIDLAPALVVAVAVVAISVVA